MIEVLKNHITNRLGKLPDNVEVVMAHFEPVMVPRGTYVGMFISLSRAAYRFL
jgi:hypothetical protein